jgi:hypothetical protein
MELYGTTQQVPFLSNHFHNLLVSGKIDWHASGFRRPGHVCGASKSGLLCAWREVLILRQHTFWHAQWDMQVDQDA